MVHSYKLGVIGNCSYMAYIDLYGSVQWMCMPRFDGSFIFGGLLDAGKGGEFSISPPFTAPGEESSNRQYYLQNTNILCTEIRERSGSFRITDFAPRFYHFERFFKPLMLIRKIEPLSGEPLVRVVCSPRGDYGKVVPEVAIGSNHIRFLNLESQVRLTTDIPITYVLAGQPFVLSQTCYCVFTYGEPLEAPLASTAEEFLRRTTDYWVKWVQATSIPSIYQDEVIRSALALKLHHFEDTGGIIAAGSTSLPEYDGAGRNWDYRYCWVRDSYYTLNALNRLGHFNELEHYSNFIQNIMVNESDAIQPVYGLSGEKLLTEKELSLEGFRGNRPVRIGNSAFRQVQNDVYGQLLISMLPLYLDRRLENEHHPRRFRMTDWLLSRIEKTMEEPDAGIWEFRNRHQKHCYTYLFHWAGCRAALKIAGAVHDTALAARAQRLGDRAAAKIEACYDASGSFYSQAIGVPHHDASTMQLIIMHYLDPGSSRAGSHLTALEKTLRTRNGLFRRYVHPDDFGTPQTAFLVCTFWYAEALACVGRVDDACAAIELGLKTANHLGLLSEDADESFGQWGNFPQTYCHVGLINAVCRVGHRLDRPLFF
jgi:GH15 family glucan-1,4-alpha-glucosidase